jgi:hypothetical protein
MGLSIVASGADGFARRRHSIFGGEVEASNTPTIRRPIPSCRHQLSPIAHLWAISKDLTNSLKCSGSNPAAPTG